MGIREMGTMKHIRQKHNNGCGIACIAMIAQISYSTVLQWTNPKRHWFFQKVTPPGWTEIIRVLKNTGLQVGNWEWGTVYLSEITTPSIIAIQFNEKASHVVVWDPKTQQILDPGQKLNTFYNKYYEGLSIGKLSLL